MVTPTAAQPDRFTGLPPGVKAGPLGQRFVAYLIDALLPTVLLAVPVLAALGEGEVGAVSVVSAVIGLLGAALVWWQIATRAAGPGMRLMKLQLVGFTDGRPVGWTRALVRAVLLLALTVTGLGLVLLVAYLVLHPRRQGWHDLVADAVVIRERMLAPRRRTSRAAVPAGRSTPVEPSGRPDNGDTEAPAPEPKSSAMPVAHGDASLVPIRARASQDSAEAAASGSSAVAAPAAKRAPVRSSGAVATAPPVQAQRQWVAVLDDGRELAVHGLMLLGRNPQPRPGEEFAEMVKLADQTRTVSKTHLSLDLDGENLVVVDRASTNGSTVTWPNGRMMRCSPGRSTAVPDGAVVSMGDHWLKARRR